MILINRFGEISQAWINWEKFMTCFLIFCGKNKSGKEGQVFQVVIKGYRYRFSCRCAQYFWLAVHELNGNIDLCKEKKRMGDYVTG